MVFACCLLNERFDSVFKIKTGPVFILLLGDKISHSEEALLLHTNGNKKIIVAAEMHEAYIVHAKNDFSPGKFHVTNTSAPGHQTD